MQAIVPHRRSGTSGGTALSDRQGRMGQVIYSKKQPYRVSVVCSGNICRSPIAEKVLAAAIMSAGLDDQVELSSAGTGPWHAGGHADQRARQVLAEAGLPTEHLAHQIDAAELADLDLVLAADEDHLRILSAMTDQPDKVRLLLDFAPGRAGQEVPDPYHSHGLSEFRAVLALAQAAAPGVVSYIAAELGR